MDKIYEVSYEYLSQIKKLYFKEVHEGTVFEIARDVLGVNDVRMTHKNNIIDENNITVRKFSDLGNQTEITIYVTEIDLYESYSSL